MLGKPVAGIAGQASPMTWPFSAAMSKSFPAKRGIEFDIIYATRVSTMGSLLAGILFDLEMPLRDSFPLYARAPPIRPVPTVARSRVRALDKTTVIQ